MSNFHLHGGPLDLPCLSRPVCLEIHSTSILVQYPGSSHEPVGISKAKKIELEIKPFGLQHLSSKIIDSNSKTYTFPSNSNELWIQDLQSSDYYMIRLRVISTNTSPVQRGPASQSLVVQTLSQDHSKA